jgi:hypothetical protein
VADGDHRAGFWRGWTRWDKIVAIGLAAILLVVTAEIAVEYFEERREQRAEREQDLRTQKREAAIRECVIDVVEGIRTYLNERGEIANRDRESVNRVIRAVADSRRAGSTDPSSFDAALRNFERVQRQVEKDRRDSRLSDFPTGQCVEEIEPLEEPEAVEPTEPAEEEDSTGQSDDGAAAPPREDKAAKKSSRRAPPKKPDRPTRPDPPRPSNPPVVDIDPPELPELPDLPDVDITVPGILRLQAAPGEGVDLDLLPEPSCDR